MWAVQAHISPSISANKCTLHTSEEMPPYGTLNTACPKHSQGTKFLNSGVNGYPGAIWARNLGPKVKVRVRPLHRLALTHV